MLAEVNRHTRLDGQARKCLGTALRVKAVRGALGPTLSKEAGYIASASDAFRHLTGTDMDFTCLTVVNALQSMRKPGEKRGTPPLGEELQQAECTKKEAASSTASDIDTEYSMAAADISADIPTADLAEEIRNTFSAAFVSNKHFVWEPKPSLSDVDLQAGEVLISLAKCDSTTIAPITSGSGSDMSTSQELDLC